MFSRRIMRARDFRKVRRANTPWLAITKGLERGRRVRALAIRPSRRHPLPMHRRLVFEEPVSRAAVWSRRLAWFALTALLLALLAFRLGEGRVEELAPIAGA